MQVIEIKGFHRVPEAVFLLMNAGHSGCGCVGPACRPIDKPSAQRGSKEISEEVRGAFVGSDG